MKGLLIEFKKMSGNESGFAFTVMFLLLIPVLVFLMISSTEIARTERATNETLQQALSNAVKDAAHMVDEESQAMGEPKIDYEKAYNRFVESLSYNLLLLNNDYDGSLNIEGPSDVSSITGNLKYWLLIYNGDDKYKGYKDGKVVSYAYFTNENDYYEFIIDESETGFPKQLYVTQDGFSDESGISITLKSPSVIAVITTNINPVVSDKEGKKVTRWALARVVQKK